MLLSTQRDCIRLFVILFLLSFLCVHSHTNCIAHPLIPLIPSAQDSGFSENVHGRVRVSEVPWYRDRIVKNISLGSLIMLLLLRLIQQNLTQVAQGNGIAIVLAIF